MAYYIQHIMDTVYSYSYILTWRIQTWSFIYIPLIFTNILLPAQLLQDNYIYNMYLNIKTHSDKCHYLEECNFNQYFQGAVLERNTHILLVNKHIHTINVSTTFYSVWNIIIMPSNWLFCMFASSCLSCEAWLSSIIHKAWICSLFKPDAAWGF